MTKGRIINAIFVLSVLGAALSVYLFYFKEKIATYALDKRLGEQRKTALKTVQTDFDGRGPEWLSGQWRANIPTWTSTINRRANYFSYGEWISDIPQPEEERTLKFWYDEVMRKMLSDFYQTKVYKKFPNRPDLFPAENQFLGDIRVETLDQWSNLDIDSNRVNQQLTNLIFGFAASNLLLENNATSITSIICMPPTLMSAYGGIAEKRTIDTTFTMSADDLIALLETVRTTDHYFTVEGVKIEYPYIGYPVEPQLKVDMLLTQAAFNKDKLQIATAPQTETLAAASSNIGRRPSRVLRTAEKPGMFTRAWKWFKRVYLASN